MMSRVSLLIPALIVACSDASLKTVNSAPTAHITSHADRADVDADTLFTIMGVVGDADDPEESLRATWMTESGVVCPSTLADTSGFTQCELSLPEGDHMVTLVAQDPSGNSSSTQVSLAAIPTQTDDTGEPSDTGEPPDTGEPHINTPPECTISAPLDGAVAVSGSVVEFTGEVSDTDDLAEELSIEWASDIDGVLGTAAASADGTVTLATDALTLGPHTVTLTATDTEGEVCTATVSLSINGQPSAPVVVIEPGPALTGDDLTAVVVTPSEDPEGDPITYSYAWSVDGTPYAGTGATISALETTRGQTWEVTVTPSDELAAGDSATASREISNTPPQVLSVTLSVDPAYTNSVIGSAVTITDEDGDPVTADYTWTVNGLVVIETGGNLDGAVFFDKGDVVVLTVTPFDTEEAGTPVSSAPLTISNTPPVAGTVTLSPDPAYTNDSITALTTMTDEDGDPIDAEYAWTVNGMAVAETSGSLSGLTDFDKHDVIVVTVTPVDDEEAGTPVSSAPLTVSNTPPGAPGIAIEPASPMEGEDTLECIIETESADDDLDAITYTIEWTVDGVPYTGPGISDFDDMWTSSETPRTGSGYGIAWADFDVDGDLDMAVANMGGVNHVYRNDGGSFTMVWSSPETDDNMSAAWADFNGDGDMDVAFGGYWGSPTRVYTGDRSTFSLAWTSSDAAEVWDLAWGDLNGDDLPDLAISHETGQNQVYENTGGDLALVWESSDSSGTLGMAWGDWDGDGDDDLAIGNQKPCGSCSPGHPDQVYQNDGGVLTLAWTAPESNGTYSLDWGDMDGDGDLDLAAGGSAGDRLTIYENTGGDLTAVFTDSPGAVSTVDWGDWDGDGDNDLMIIVDGRVEIWDNDGGSFSVVWSDGSRSWGSGAMADIDGDGAMDMATGTGSGQPTVVWDNASCPDCVPGSETAGEELWECTVTPDDGDDEGPSVSTSVTIESARVYRWAYMGTDSVGMIYGSCTHVSSYSATCAPALVGERVYINESGGAALERKALGETHLADEPGGRGYSVSLTPDGFTIGWSGATSCGGDWLRIDTVDVYECIVE